MIELIRGAVRLVHAVPFEWFGGGAELLAARLQQSLAQLEQNTLMPRPLRIDRDRCVRPLAGGSQNRARRRGRWSWAGDDGFCPDRGFDFFGADFPRLVLAGRFETDGFFIRLLVLGKAASR